MVGRGLWLPIAVAAVAAAAAITAPHFGCSREGCLAGGDDCVVPAACPELAFTCPAGSGLVEAKVLTAEDRGPGGLNALAATGDILLRNDRIVAVIDALDHPHYLAPTGGSILDLATAAGENDTLNVIFQATGLLPGDAAFYTSLELIEGEGFRAVQLRGHLQGDESQRVATRYEIRPCEPGIRVRTEIVNGAPDAAIWSVTDAWYWGGRDALPFTPHPGAGFEHPDFELTSVGDVFRPTPFLAASGHALPSAAYSVVSCGTDRLEGFHATTVSSMGLERRIVEPRDYVVFERFIAVADGASVAPAIDLALEVRRQLFDEPFTVVRGKVVAPDPEALLAGENRASIHISEGAGLPREARTPWTEVLPATDGSFAARVPAGKSYLVELVAFGRVVASTELRADVEEVDAGELMLPAAGRVSMETRIDDRRVESLVFFYPADETTRESTSAKLHGNFDACAPLLGAPHGASPACNRVLTYRRVTADVPPGRYHVYASAGPFASIARRTIDVRAGETTNVDFTLVRLPLLPAGALSADFHVHGSASFDSSIPDTSRVLAFLASGIDVIAATDHDVVSDYAAAMEQLDVGTRLVLMPGVETTGHILFDLTPDSDIPKVVGHWNFWPVPYVVDAPRNNAPVDDLLEPGLLFDAVRSKGLPAEGVIELNHPLSPSELGRDLGWPRALEVKLTEPLPRAFDGTGPSMFLRTPPGAQASNADYHVQEVMNGTNNDHFLPFRAFWFYLLDQGIVRAGTANSDSHGLTDNVLGTPRNVVWTETTRESFDVARFNADVKAGRMIGTNGPVLEAALEGADQQWHTPGTTPFAPKDGAKLRLKVSAAPWVPIDEVRIIVDGEVAMTLAGELARPSDPFGTASLVRFEGELDVAGLLPAGGRDAWIVIEAGAPLLETADLDCNGVPDTGDNNGDGVIDWRDVDADDDDDVDADDLARGEPERCDPDQDVGPLPEVPMPSDANDPAYHFWAVTPGGYPLAFTNPFLLDRDGGGFAGPGLPGER